MTKRDKLTKLIQEFHNNNFSSINTKIFIEIEALRKKISQSDIFVSHPQKKSAAELIKKDSTPPDWGRFLFMIIKTYNLKSCLELGTCLGFSGAYILAALPKFGNLLSIEGLSDRAQIAKNNFKRLGFDNFKIYNGQFKYILNKILKNNSFDCVYLDGHHKEKSTLTYFDMIYPRLRNDSIVIVDDVDWAIGMKRAWKIIKKDRRVIKAYTVNKWGICLIKKS